MMKLWVEYTHLILLICLKLTTVFGCTSTTAQYKRPGDDVTIQFKAKTVNSEDVSLSVTNEILSNTGSKLLIALYNNSVKLYIGNCTGCTFIGNASTGDLSIRLDNLQQSDAGTYKHSVTQASKEVKGCVVIYILGQPTKPSITINKVPFEGESAILTCSSTSNTTPRDPNLRMMYNWKVNNNNIPNDSRYTYSNTRNKLTISNISRNDANKHFTCTAKEDVSNAYTSSSSDRFRLDVYYKPDSGPLIQSSNGFFGNNTIFQAIGSKQQTLDCSVSGGYPSPSLSWSCFTGTEQNFSSGQTITKRWTWTASKDGTCKCTSTQLGVDSEVVLNVRIFSPPSSPEFQLNSQTVRPSSTVKIIRDSTKPITCSSTSYPPSEYKWTYNGQTTEVSQKATLNPSQVTINGRYYCNAQNTMSPSLGGQESGNSSAFIDIQRLYGPSVKPFNIGPVVEGSPLSVECKADPGNPASMTYSWRRKLNNSSMNNWQIIPDSTINGGQLEKQNIKRNDAGTYNCTASNVMKPTAESQQTGSSSQAFLLDVLYKTSIMSFIEASDHTMTEVTKHENSSINLNCTVDSNPGSYIAILKSNDTITSVVKSKQISYKEEKISCDTAGLYTCVGYNDYNGETRPSKELRLYVTCSPRLYSEEGFYSQVRGAVGERVKLEIKIKAYPVPKQSEVVWSKHDGRTWNILTENEHIKINHSGLDSSLMFLSVNVSDFQTYRVNISNNYGTLHKEFYLQPYGKPNPPENVNYMEGSLEQTSVIITWKPGFHGGLNQTFHVKYKRQSGSSWQEVTKPDEGTTLMNVTLSGLEPGTAYVYQMYSRNSEGNSDETEILTFKTIEKTDGPGPNTALIVGVVIGSVVVIVAAVVLVVLLRRFSGKKGSSKSSRDNNDRQPVYEDENDYGMRDNPMYVSAGPRQPSKATEESTSNSEVEYSTVNKTIKTIPSDNEYAEVVKTNKSKGKQGKKEKEKSKQGFFKDKKGKRDVQEGDIYENAPANAVSAKGELIYENPEPAKPTKKKNVNKDGLIYADLTFNDQPKGQKKLVIHGLDDMTEYVQVDFTKKAEPLPDSDDENIPAKQ